MTHRFFVNPEQIIDGVATITGSDVQHITRVLRLTIGSSLVVADGSGAHYEGCLISSSKDFIQVALSKKTSLSNEAPIRVTLLQGIPKGDKMEYIIQKCTELGVAKFIPVACARSIVQLNKDKADKKQARWQRIAEEAAKQSRRSQIPQVCSVVNLPQALQFLEENEALLIPWEEEKAEILKKTLYHLKGKGQKISIFIGPEGGLTPEEVALAREAGGKVVTLGPRILRTETAGLAVVSMVLYELGDLGGTFCGAK